MIKKLSILLCTAIILSVCSGCTTQNNGNSSSESSLSSSSSESSSMSSSTEESSTSEIVIKDEQLKSVYEAMKKEFGDSYISMSSPIEEQQLSEMYYINPEDVEEFYGEMSMANVSGDTFIAVKAKPGRAQAVAEALEKRKQDIIDQFATYPVNFMDIKSQAARVITEGDYVFLVLLGEIEVEDGVEATLEMAEKEIERAAETIKSVFSTTSSK